MMKSTDNVSSVLLWFPRDKKENMWCLLCLEKKGEMEKRTAVHYSCSAASPLPRKQGTQKQGFQQASWSFFKCLPVIFSELYFASPRDAGEGDGVHYPQQLSWQKEK